MTLLRLVHVNLLHGSDKENFRHEQFKAHLQEELEQAHTDSPLFMSLSGRIVEALRSLGYAFDTETPGEEQAWEYLRERAQQLPEGKRTTMCRFQAVAGSLRANMPWWSVHLYERVLVGLQEDFLHNRTFINKFARRQVGQADEPDEGH